MSEMKDVRLLPCPFCGAQPRMSTYVTESLWSHDQVTYTKVSCDECEISFHSEPGFEIEAPAAWNRRAALEPAPKPKYSARDAFLSLTDGSNWPEMKGDYFSGYQDAMEQVHQHVMDFWPELSATDLPEPAPKPAGGEWVMVPREPTADMLAMGDEAMVDTVDTDNWLAHCRNAWAAMLSAAPPPPSADAQDVGKLAWNCDKWPAWLHEIVDQTNVEADKWDMSTEQAIALGVLTGLTTYKRSTTDGQS